MAIRSEILLLLRQIEYLNIIIINVVEIKEGTNHRELTQI